MNKKVITLNRQYGSGGREIGEKLAKELGVPFYDNQIISRAAKESGFSEMAFESMEDKASNSLLYSIAMGMNVFGNQDMSFNGLSLDDRIFLAQSNVIRKVAEEGGCVIVGRCADYILRDYDDIVNVFVSANLDFRIKRSIKEYDIPDGKAGEIVAKKDKSRSNYYRYHVGERWEDLTNYDLVIRSDLVGIDRAVTVLKTYIEGIV
ncbi:AAA family ATPase [Eubacterium xylanophilum]|uniref:cytidylate kinase-like family protein n=1 Tax=Eubacterium xylanophilum TaxID=39497 RepID=UPI000479A5CF|nr:cytidylate kinase-like family protein [Eubacterium xylanophilum]